MGFKGFDAFAESPVFENIIHKEALDLNIAFVCFYGSRNYNLETDKSDYDFFIAYYPSFENFYFNKFSRSSVIEKDYDYFITPFHEYLRHAMNGNIKFIEPIICDTVFIENSFYSQNLKLIEKVKNFILINVEKNFKSMYGIIKNKKLNVEKGLYTSNTLKYKETHGYDIKEAINSLRIAFLLENYINTGEFSFRVNRNPVYKEFVNYLSGINNRTITKNNYLEIINKKMEDIDKAERESLAGVKAINASDAMHNEAQFRRNIEQDIVEICRDKACFAKNNRYMV